RGCRPWRLWRLLTDEVGRAFPILPGEYGKETEQRTPPSGSRGAHIMSLARRRFLQLAGAAVAAPAVTRAAWAQSYPARPVRLIIGYTPGGPADLPSRLIPPLPPSP